MYIRPSANWIDVLSKWIDLSHVIKLSLTIRFFLDSIRQTMANITTVFEGTCNLQSLKMLAHRTPSSTAKIFRGICAILPRQLKYLQINITNVDEMKMIMERLIHLCSVTFEFLWFETISSVEIIDWFKIHVIDFSFRVDNVKVYFWLGKYVNKSSEIKVGAKRMKLTHH